MVWWLMKECFSTLIRPLQLTARSGECVAVKFCTVVSYLLTIAGDKYYDDENNYDDVIM